MMDRKDYKRKTLRNDKILPGDPQGLPDDFSKVVVFIDNAYLMRLKKYFFSEGLKYSTKKFVENIAGKSHLFIEKIFLYDAPPFQSNGSNFKEKKMREIYDRFISFFEKDGIVVREGRTQRLKVDNSFIYRQKGVDMLLGIDMVGTLREFPGLKKVILLSGDSDFVPVVEKLKSFGVEVSLWTYFERDRKSPFSRSNYLLRSATDYIKLNKENFLEAMLDAR